MVFCETRLGRPARQREHKGVGDIRTASREDRTSRQEWRKWLVAGIEGGPVEKNGSGPSREWASYAGRRLLGGVKEWRRRRRGTELRTAAGVRRRW